jgi:hypothetical protein
VGDIAKSASKIELCFRNCAESPLLASQPRSLELWSEPTRRGSWRLPSRHGDDTHGAVVDRASYYLAMEMKISNPRWPEQKRAPVRGCEDRGPALRREHGVSLSVGGTTEVVSTCWRAVVASYYQETPNQAVDNFAPLTCISLSVGAV